ncbi:ABC transporter ATP-binding protein [Acrocarpospora corrugata]|uniref:ABC transporter ATP-binding protein n=1 Tax=Acrocarpospora corrugata TaxID=35763 RepID=A0A5M3VZD6_9ACTN|nr:ABC transporter ATP-binding protein [Acrocarpospora corrugata]GES00453.1 ABC transporter ATP-binding protein [Acrocarpospora corrugata]
MNAIAFDQVSRSYGDALAVDRLDLEIPRARTVALLGPNGAGKSTSISLLLGLIRPTSGTVRVFGRTPEEAVSGGEVGAMLQDGTLIPELTVAETVDFIRRLYPRPLGLAEILRIADLTEVAKRRADRLSGGQIQRVRFALAIAGAPRLLVLDEPTAAMDVESRRRLWASMRAYAADGHTVLFTTHYLEEADENADRVIVIARGKVVADGTAAEIKAGAGGQTASFAIGGQPSGALATLPHVSGVELRSGRATLRTADLDATIAALYRGTTLDVRDLRIGGADLEEAFLALTREA